MIVINKLLQIKNLHTSFYTREGEINVLNGISFDLYENEIIGLMGESGSGKSVTMSSLLGILPCNGKIIEGEIIFQGKDMIKLSEKELEKIRGNEISIAFQSPKDCLNPVFTIGEQLIEHYRLHKKVKKSEAYIKAVEMLKLVQLPNAEKRIKQYPHQFSGGELQRIMLAVALMCTPKILIADEITSALDILTQNKIINLLKQLKDKLGMSIIFITHDLEAAAMICNKIYELKDGIVNKYEL